MNKQMFGKWPMFILLALIWGSSFILMKKSAETLTGWQIGAVRLVASGLVLLPFAVFHVSAIPARKLPIVFLSGLLGNLFPAFLFGIAIQKEINSSLAGILNSLTPLFVIVLGVLFFRVRLEKKKILGVLTGFAGLLLMSLAKGPLTFSGQSFTLLILLATFFYGLNVNIVGQFLKGIDPLKLATVSVTSIAIPAAFILWQQDVVSLATYDSEARVGIAMAALLGVMGTAAATVLFYMLIKTAGGLFASLVTYVIPVVAILWGLLAHEEVSPVQIGCLGLILGGVYLANR
jgi:drug/metabolite transporter (DMT)-like permease